MVPVIRIFHTHQPVPVGQPVIAMDDFFARRLSLLTLRIVIQADLVNFLEKLIKYLQFIDEQSLERVNNLDLVCEAQIVALFSAWPVVHNNPGLPRQ